MKFSLLVEETILNWLSGWKAEDIEANLAFAIEVVVRAGVAREKNFSIILENIRKKDAEASSRGWQMTIPIDVMIVEKRWGCRLHAPVPLDFLMRSNTLQHSLQL